MKFKFILSLCFLLQQFLSFGQFVSIPDNNFRAFLQTNYSSCFTGNLLDTNCAKTQTTTTFQLNNKSIADLTGIQYFEKLQILYCRNNSLTTLPTLPNSLKELYCDSNQIASLPKLPTSLQDLWCKKNQLTSLPTIPNNLGGINCSYNLISNLPNSLANVVELNCDNNQLVSLPPLTNIDELSCRNNQITSISTLRSDASLLYCDNNQLTSLPALPSSLNFLTCSNNQITTLPTLPISLDSLSCGNNQLNCLPILPNQLRSLKASGNSIVCIPNIPSPNGYTFTSDIGKTVCNGSNNVHGCPIGTSILTSVEMDQGINLYPNPTKSKVVLNNSLAELQEASIKILSAEGREVYSIDNSDLNSLSIDLSKEQRGIYYIQIISEGSTIVKKLVIE